MATGPEHYRIAEGLADMAVNLADDGEHEEADMAIAAAQVHATLALAAATALNGISARPSTTATYRAWEALVTEPAQS